MTFSSSSSQYFILPTDDLERSSLQSKQAKTTKKSNYGSLRQDLQTQQTAKTFIVNYEHQIMPGDTLLGISLKYNVPIENIKRANRLWSNDLTFLKETLIIPLDKEKLKAMNLETINSERNVSKTNSLNQISNDQESNSNMEKAEYKDFLNKFDSLINESKMKLKTLETNNYNHAITEYLNNTEKYNQNSDNNNNSFRDDDLFYRNDSLFKDVSTSSGKSKTESGSISSTSSSNLSSILQRSSNSNLTSNGHASDVPDHVITGPNKYSNFYGSNHNLISSTDGSSDRAKLAKENLQRLEREKDDLYEL